MAVRDRDETKMAATLKLEIVTPEAKVFSEDVEWSRLPGVEGEMGIYPKHVPLMTQMVAGEIIARKRRRGLLPGRRRGLRRNHRRPRGHLTDMAIRAENIDEAKAEEARRRAEARLAEQLDDEEAATVNAALAHSLAQLKVKRRQRP